MIELLHKHRAATQLVCRDAAQTRVTIRVVTRLLPFLVSQ